MEAGKLTEKHLSPSAKGLVYKPTRRNGEVCSPVGYDEANFLLEQIIERRWNQVRSNVRLLSENEVHQE